MSKKNHKQPTPDEQRARAQTIINTLIDKDILFSTRLLRETDSVKKETATIIEIYARDNANEARALFPTDFDTRLDGGQNRISLARIIICQNQLST